MSQIEHKSTHLHNTLNQLTAYYDIFLQNGDGERASKVERLAEKLNTHELILAFCGHFSAGKSTIINRLMGEDILPSSPIPTSANLVKVHQAQTDFAKIHYHQSKPLYFKAPYDFETIKDFCKNGEDVYSVEIGRKRSDVPEGVSVLDTPGVDSTDDAHRLSTESAIHLADAVFYVMDYNHVQSQVNFEFTKEMVRHGVKLYLIVNQIDKHQEEELSFSEFQESVKNSFASWGVVPDGTFFTSLKNPDHPYNDLEKLKALIDGQVKQKDELIEESAVSAISQLRSEHEKWYEEELEKLEDRALDFLTDEEWEKKDSILLKERKLVDTLAKNDVASIKDQFEEERREILKNAYLMPFETRELAKDFLESRQQDFKVGFLFSKQKTEEEKALRLQRFKEDINSRIESQLEWHLKTLGKNIVKEYIPSSDQRVEWDRLNLEVDDHFLVDLIKQGAGVSSDYVLQYCDDLSEELKRKARNETNGLIEGLINEIENSSPEENAGMEEELAELQKKTGIIYQWNSLNEEKDAQIRRLTKAEVDPKRAETIMSKWTVKWKEREEMYTLASDVVLDRKGDTGQERDINQSPDVKVQLSSKEEAIQRLEAMADVFRKYKGFTKMAHLLDGKRERLSNQSFTIALFGAFSAGKSSFANALLGRKVLPVSPNPTTASINRINPVSEECEHETAHVHIKTGEQLMTDINHSLSFFNRNASSLDEAAEMIPDLSTEGSGKENVHLSFLQAFLKGYPSFKETLGSRRKVDLEEYKGYVADEAKACFVESIDLYFDCEITRQGITLVDTPGADSINARHTGVAFEYIKNADAILFVTYYNHAFAKADREFLIQLGRVKDTFELDKMFFVVNAIDLASDEKEKNEVIDYVEDQLIQYGIRFPRIFGVSSLQALKESASHQSGMEVFKEEFQAFIQNELVSMSIESALGEWERGLKRFQQYLVSASSEKTYKQSRKRELLERKSEVESIIDDISRDPLTVEMLQESKELVHYVKQRVFFRVPDFYKEAFHSGLFLQYPSQSLAIREGLKEFLSSIGFDLAQEMRATSLRIQQFIQKQLRDQWAAVEEKIQRVEQDLVLSPMDDKNETSIEFESAFNQTELRPFEEAFSTFKNPKHFFEKGGKKVVQEKLEALLQEPADLYLIQERSRLDTWGQSYLEEEFKLLKEELLSQVTDQITSYLEALETVQDLDQLKRDLLRLEEA
ncbi:dynamin family protein [Rossellomorea vietnamensis]|uniref:Dynamin family protein n=1 Tax=Rossellomorea vietnamensis TaxID=218284 RepID=A0ACD4C7V6_9BACI|nr:dynamin family protein [Rossellomorea vietnamensis]UXH44705.1 dynamin family protein [Rossellomorea vietnamensis]